MLQKYSYLHVGALEYRKCVTLNDVVFIVSADEDVILLQCVYISHLNNSNLSP